MLNFLIQVISESGRWLIAHILILIGLLGFALSYIFGKIYELGESLL